jgi:ATP adenylyltransferase
LLVVGSPWRVSLDNPSCRTFTETRVQRELFDYSNGSQTVSNPNSAHVTGTLQRPDSVTDLHLLLCGVMDYLWTPWRYAYVANAEKTTGCIFCEAAQAHDDRTTRIVYRGRQCFIILNAYPYTPGHAMIVPYTHLDELRKLPTETANEMTQLSQRMESVLRELYHPDGINLGMNLGKAAGAGIAGHIHMHLLPRWVADANFMSVVGETRILPETLDATWQRMTAALAGKN